MLHRRFIHYVVFVLLFVLFVHGLIAVAHAGEISTSFIPKDHPVDKPMPNVGDASPDNVVQGKVGDSNGLYRILGPDTDGVADITDLDDDNDGIPDEDEITCNDFVKANFEDYAGQPTSSVNDGNLKIGASVFTVTHQTYGDATINTDEISDAHYTGEYGVRVGHPSGTTGTYDDRIETTFQFSDLLRSPKFRINDIDYGDHVIVEVYDEHGQIINITSSMYSLYSPTIVQVNGNEFYAADTDGSSNNSRLGTVDFDFQGYSVSKIVFKYWDPEASGTVTYTEFKAIVCDFDKDGIPNYLDVDSDNDGISDLIESGQPASRDSNNDGMLDDTTDNDHDGLMSIVDADDNDPDSGGTVTPVDSDNDGHPDYLDIDADNDGIVDNIEGQTTAGYTAPTGNDTDGDGFDDAYDVNNGGTAVVPTDTDNDGTPDYLDLDSDNDGDSDALEGWDTDNDGVADTTPSGTDADGDGLDDAYDNDTTAVNPTNGTTPSSYPDLDDPGGDRDWREALAADLSLEKTANPTSAVPGDTVTFALALTNDGPGDAPGVQVTDQLPSGYTYVSSSAGQGTYDNNTGIWDVGTLSRDSTVTLTITVTVNGNGDYENTAEVTASDAEDPDSTPNNGDPTEDDYASTTVTVTPQADLGITITDTPDPVNAGDPLTYTLTVSNTGPSDAETITVTLDLPSDVTYDGASGDGWTCSESGGTVTCTRPNVPAGTTVPDITVNTTVNSDVPDGTTLTADAEVDSATPDPTPDNNTDSEETTVQASADLGIEITDTPDPVNAGDPLTYTLTVSNTGPSDAETITVTLELPSDVTYDGASGDGWTCSESGGTVTCTRPNVPAGTTVPDI
ncbi:MAG: DUF11 domain-containing protein, partial [Chloroflexi bacterium]|nr:DUF11 domain-containing protein [Chloroflexota bacterium]